MKIAMTGASGHMGSEALRQTLELPDAEVRVLLTRRRRNHKLAKKLKKRYGARVEILFGDVSEQETCEKLVEGTDYVVHMAAVIPPRSDADYAASEACNERGAMLLADAILRMPRQAKFIDITSIALYGCRNEKHPFCRVGDPLVISPFDMYSLHKLRGERYVLEAGLARFAVLRQTAMLHPDMIESNMSDGLMFHTNLNAPLEWVSARDSGYLIRRILEDDSTNELSDFWNRVYNIGGGLHGRQTGYDTFRVGFSVIGGSAEKFFRPAWMASRNFHGVWMADGGVLEERFRYQRDGVEEIWADLKRKHRIYRLAKLVPAALIRKCFFGRLLNHPNSPMRWRRDGDEARVCAFYGGEARANAIPKDWRSVKLIARGDFGDYDRMRDEAAALREGKLLSHGFDGGKPLSAWTAEDARSAAEFRGGACLKFEDVRKRALWKCAAGHTFEATPYTVMGAGHWCPQCAPQPWDFDLQAKTNAFYAQVWYDTHDRDEDVSYTLDGAGKAALTHTEEA